MGKRGNWSGKRDSNSRLPPWQGGALPTELFPLCLLYVKQERNSNEVRLGVKPNHAHTLNYLPSAYEMNANRLKTLDLRLQYAFLGT